MKQSAFREEGAATGGQGDRRKRRVTISDLADALGLTKGTVSRALNGYTDISESTRRRVLARAEAMGYRPLAPAQAIRTGRTRAIGLVLQNDWHDAQRPFLSEFLEGLSTAASAEHWTMTVATAGSDAEMLETLERLLDERKADGFVLPRTRREDHRIGLLREAGVPFVLYGRTGDGAGCAWYDILGEDAMRDAVRRLVALGHRRIAYVGAGTLFNFSGLRRAGFRTGLAEAGLPEDPALQLGSALTRDEGAAAARRLWQLDMPPTAIVFAVDAAALGAYRAAAELGLVVGRDVSLIGYDGIPDALHADPALTTFRVDTRAAGSRLAELLIRRIRGAAPETLRECVPAHLEQGGSDGPPALSPAALARCLRHDFDKTQKPYREETA